MNDDLARIMSYVEPITESGCWIWHGAIQSNGYGRTWINPKRPFVHRAVYELVRGPIPEGLILDHLCRVRCCVNPDHLQPVTDRVNILRGTGFSARNAIKTHCPQGHEYTTNNTGYGRQASNKRSKYRYCRLCRKVSSAFHYRERRSRIVHP